MAAILIYTTTPTEEKAKIIAKHLLEKRFIACANIFPIQSIYRWENKITEDKEFVLLLKTLEKNYRKVKEEIEKIHPYKIPCIAKINISPNKKYSNWLEKEIKN
ncbi:TPA: divalent-cation tolerance protein CutA [archaeon]|nr:divalent-cation tolerance protein CutA [Candidatus Naiadarchaeales archaeon SRR2090153.bin1042]